MKTTSHLDFSGRRAKHVIAWLVIAALVSLAPMSVAADATLSEMLELGIYSEETKGDVPAAMKLYEQIVAESDADQALAAQAQFRLAMCQHKQKNYTAATASFEKLVRDYPAQKDLVALANEYLADGAALLPVPWGEHEQLVFDVNLPSGMKIGGRVFSTDASEVDGRKIWTFGTNMFVATGSQHWSRVTVDAASFRPMRCEWRILPIGESDTTYTATGADTKVKGKDDVKHFDLSGAVYDNEQALQLMRRLPLEVGYKTQLKIFVGIGGGTLLPIELSVPAMETITVPAGTFECFKVVLNIGQTMWFAANQTRQPVKLEAGGAALELTQVTSYTPNESVVYRDPVFEFTITTPANWLVTRKEKADDKRSATLLFADGDGVSAGSVKVESIDRLPEAARASVRAFAEHEIEGGRKHAKRLEIRPDSWRELTVAGQPAVSFVVDVEQNLGAQVRCGVYSFVDGNAVQLWTATTAEDFDAIRPQFDAVVASYQTK